MHLYSIACGHVTCARCIARLRRRSLRNDEETRCEGCQVSVVDPPAPGDHALQAQIDAVVKAEGLKVKSPRKMALKAIWAPEY